MNTLYHAILASKVQAAIVQAKALAQLHHNGEKGYLREKLASELFRPLLPATFGIGTGVIVNSLNEQSTQCDIIIYDNSLVPALITAESHGVFPIESVLYVIEVKSKLDATGLQSAHSAATSLREQARGVRRGQRIPTSCVFAFESDVTGSESERYDEYRDREPMPALKAICVAGKEYSYWSTSINPPGWRKWPGSDPVVGFLGGLMNQLPGLGQVKMGEYLTDE